jgi:hypothetical protein
MTDLMFWAAVDDRSPRFLTEAAVYEDADAAMPLVIPTPPPGPLDADDAAEADASRDAAAAEDVKEPVPGGPADISAA